MVGHVGVVADEVEFRQAFSHHLGFHMPMLHTHLSMKGWHNGTMCGCITKGLNLTPLLQLLLSLTNVPVLIFCEYFITVLAVKLLILSFTKLESVDSQNVTIFSSQL